MPTGRWKVRQANSYLEAQVSAKGLPEEVPYRESRMPSSNFEGKYTLVSGKWPTKPSEVVITSSLRREIGGGGGTRPRARELQSLRRWNG